MRTFVFTATAVLLLGTGASAQDQTAATDSCDPTTIAQALGFEDIEGCTGADASDGLDTAQEPVDDADAIAPGHEGLATASEASGGRSDSALAHANEMSGGAVKTALNRPGRDDDDDDGDDSDEDDAGSDRGGDRGGSRGGGKPDGAGRP